MSKPLVLDERAVWRRLHRGDMLRMEFAGDGARHYWFEAPDAIVPAAIMQAILSPASHHHLPVMDADSLFGVPGTGQTLLAVRGRA